MVIEHLFNPKPDKQCAIIIIIIRMSAIISIIIFRVCPIIIFISRVCAIMQQRGAQSGSRPSPPSILTLKDIFAFVYLCILHLCICVFGT